MTHSLLFGEPDVPPARKLLWSTDLHLDAADKAQHLQFFDLVQAHQPDAILIGGDISNGSNSLIHLKHLVKLINKSFYFVLGNHDFYYGSIRTIRKMAEETVYKDEHLIYLTSGGVIELTSSTALIGHDGWSDGRAGDFLKSDVLLNDYFLIDELKNLQPEERLARLNDLGTEAAEDLTKKMKEAIAKKYKRVIILTHVPPFKEACLYDGKVTDDNWSPHFVGVAVGEALKQIAKEHPEHQFLVLCGHSHNSADIQVTPNLRVLAGESEFGIPSIQGLIYIN